VKGEYVTIWYRLVLVGLFVVSLAACGAAPAAEPDAAASPEATAPQNDAVATPDAPAETPTTATAEPTAEAPADAADDPTADADLSFTDATDTTVTLEAAPERIVCVTEICTDILFDLGLEPVAVPPGGIAPLPEFFGEQAESFAIIGGSFFEPSLEDIAQARPDLVIGLGGVHEGLRDGLQAIAPLYIMGPRTYEDSLAYLQDVGRLTGRTAEADAVAERFRERLAAYREQAPKDKTVLVMYGSDVNFGIDTAGALVGDMLSELTNYPWPAPAPGTEGHASGGIQFSLEEVLEQNPDVLFVETFGFGPTPPEPLSEQLAANPLWSEIKAVQEGEVHEVSFAIWGTGRGVRSLSLVLDEAMTRTYPDVFPEPLP
jgi:iron complex transport system substrate-binding protein